MRTERDLIASALALLGRLPADLCRAELRLSRRVRGTAPRGQAARLARAIKAGADPLGDAFLRIRSAPQRRPSGAVYTPKQIVRAMVRWSARIGSPSRIVDPGAGSGRFLFAAARVHRRAHLVAIESDPLAALLLRANARVLGLDRRMTVLVSDYRNVALKQAVGRTLFLGNPPYVRHHQIQRRWKEWFARSALKLNVRASKLAGLHVHFVVKTMQLARPGDFGAFVTSAEWLDVNYGSTVRDLLLDGMGGAGLHVIDARTQAFENAATTASIFCFKVGEPQPSMVVRSVERLSELGSLAQGVSVATSRLATSSRWSTIVRPGRRHPNGFIELGELCRVHRGQVTGANEVWIAGEAAAANLPDVVLRPTITKARELLRAEGVLSDPETLRRVIDLPQHLEELEDNDRRAVMRFLEWAKQQGAHQSYVAQHRKPWWSVNLKAPAPIVCTYMARRPPAFVRNLCDARHINIAHGIYPREAMTSAGLDALARWLNGHVGVEGGRTYAGGLTKFEPRELERVPIPKPENMAA